MSATHAGWMLSYASVFGMIGALSAPSLERRLHHPGVVLLICVALAGTGYVGLIAAPVSGDLPVVRADRARPGRAARTGARLHRRPRA